MQRLNAAIERIKFRSFVRWYPVLILLVAAVLRFHLLGAQSLWNDEGNSLRLAERTFPALIDAAARDIHPPGYYIALKFWLIPLGYSEFALRSLSAFASLLTVAFTYALGRRLFAPGVGLIAALFVAINGFQIYYAQEARMYALVTLWAVAALWAFIGWLRRPNARDGLLFALLNVAGLYTHYVYPAMLLIQGAIVVGALLMVATRRRERLIGFIKWNLLTLACFAPVIAIAWRQITTWPSTGQPTDPVSGLVTVAGWLTYGNSAPRLDWVSYLWPALFVIAFFIPDWLRRRLPFRLRSAVPLLWLLALVVPFFAFGLFRDANLKFLLPAQIGLALIIGRGAWILWELGTPNLATALLEAFPRMLAAFGVMAMLSTAGDTLDNLYNRDYYARDDYRAMARVVGTEPRPGDAVILDAPNQLEVFSYYYTGAVPVFPLPVGLGGDDDATRDAVRRLIAEHQRIYVLFWGANERDPHGVVESELNARANPVYSRYYGRVRFVLYTVAGAPASAPTQTIGANFGDAITLRGAAIDKAAAPAGDVIGITLFWQARQPIAQRYKVFIHLLDSDGKLVAQRDSEPGNGTLLTTLWTPDRDIIDQHGLLIPPTLPRGIYRIIVGLYDLDNPAARLPIGDQTSIGLGMITIN